MLLGRTDDSAFRTNYLIFKITVLLLIANGVHSYRFREWYQQPRRTYLDFPTFDRENPTYSDPGYAEAAPGHIDSRSSIERQDTRRTIHFPRAPSTENNVRPMIKQGFPEYPVTQRQMQVPVCKGSTFCEEASNYPMDLVNNALRNDRSLQNYENVDAVNSIATRFDPSDSETLCLANERVVFPKTAETMNNEWMFVVNHPNFTQGVRIETCDGEGNGCRMIDGFAEGYTTSCKQKYIYRQLTAVVPDGSIGREFFRFPATCCCHVQFTGIASRMGSAQSRGSDKSKAT